MKLRFDIQDIPEGESTRTLRLERQDLQVEPHTFRGGQLQLEFNRTLYFIQIDFHIQALVQLTCDRSLEIFDHDVEANYKIIYKVGIEENIVSEDSIIKPFDFDSRELDIEGEVRDTLLLNIPAKKIHPKFMDEYGNVTEFETKKFGEGAEDDNIDPRWNALKELKENS